MAAGDEQFENINPGDVRPRIEPGLWPAACIRHEFKVGPYGEKLWLYWKVFISPDCTQSVVLHRYYNVDRDENGKLAIGHLHAYRRDWISARNGKWPGSLNNLPVSVFKKGLFLVQVVDVQKTADGPLPPALYWSRIGPIIRPVDEGETWQRLPAQVHENQRKKSHSLGRV